MAQRSIFDQEEALELWRQGHCWYALGEKYGYAGSTIKLNCRKVAEADLYKRYHEEHCNNHKWQCMKCKYQMSHGLPKPTQKETLFDM